MSWETYTTDDGYMAALWSSDGECLAVVSARSRPLLWWRMLTAQWW